MLNNQENFNMSAERVKALDDVANLERQFDPDPGSPNAKRFNRIRTTIASQPLAVPDGWIPTDSEKKEALAAFEYRFPVSIGGFTVYVRPCVLMTSKNAVIIYATTSTTIGMSHAHK